MNINKRFNKKFKDLIIILEHSNEFSQFQDVLFDILNHSDFNQNDFFDLLDFVASKPLNAIADIQHFEIIMSLLSYDLSEYYRNWNQKTINKYKKFFKSIENMLIIYDMPVEIFDYFGHFLNWQMILWSTFFIDNEYIDEITYYVLEKHYRIIFDNTSTEIGHEPADGLIYLYTLSIGVNYPYSYIKDSFMKQSSTFAVDIVKNGLIESYIKELNQKEVYEKVIFEFDFGGEEDPLKVNIPLDVAFRRIIADREFMDFLEINLDDEDDKPSSFIVDDDFDF